VVPVPSRLHMPECSTENQSKTVYQTVKMFILLTKREDADYKVPYLDPVGNPDPCFRESPRSAVAFRNAAIKRKPHNDVHRGSVLHYYMRLRKIICNS
jgi:hypothetical protein